MTSAYTRPATIAVDVAQPFVIDAKDRSYKHQYSNIYFTRLHSLKPAVMTAADGKWGDSPGSPTLVPRLLEVVKGHLCYIVGTVYLEMPLKPNVLEDIGRDRSIPPPAERPKFWSDDDGIMLEDESGRIRLVGEHLEHQTLVTGVIMAALGMETSNGDFNVVDCCFAGLPPHQHQPQEDLMDTQEEEQEQEWIAIVSGLDVGAESNSEEALQLLTEYLANEIDVGIHPNVSATNISRIIIAGNSLAHSSQAGNMESMIEPSERRPVRHVKAEPTFSRPPIEKLSDCLLDIAGSMPLHILPGSTDPTGTILPQQALPRAMLGPISGMSTFRSETNPALLRISSGHEGTTQRTSDLLVTSGQTIDDMFKYVKTPPVTRLNLAEGTLQWRHLAPTAPDTLWCHPYFTKDPFILENTPHAYVIGNQPEYATKLIHTRTDGDQNVQCRIILVPRFSQTGLLVLFNPVTLAVRTIRLSIPARI